MSLNLLHMEARTLIKRILQKFKERRSQGAKYDHWFSPEKESAVNHSFDSVYIQSIFDSQEYLDLKKEKYLKNSMDKM